MNALIFLECFGYGIGLSLLAPLYALGLVAIGFEEGLFFAIAGYIIGGPVGAYIGPSWANLPTWGWPGVLLYAVGYVIILIALVSYVYFFGHWGAPVDAPRGVNFKPEAAASPKDDLGEAEEAMPRWAS